jgi:voltage-gated potassium channel
MAVSVADKRETSSYELFIAALSIFSIVNILLVLLPLQEGVKTVIEIIDTSLCAVFLADFFSRLLRARSKSDYFLRQFGWLDLLGSLPFPGLRIARVFRVARVIRIIRRVGLKALYRQFVGDRAGSALYAVLFLCLVVVQYASIFELVTQRYAPHANITSASDAVWYVIATITTVGYGDQYPVTNAGRIVGVVTMILGIGLFGVLTGFLANTFLAPKPETPDEQPAEQPGGEPAPRPAPMGVGAQLDQLTAEVAQLRRLLLERLPTGQSLAPSAPATPAPRQAVDPARAQP